MEVQTSHMDLRRENQADMACLMATKSWRRVCETTERVREMIFDIAGEDNTSITSK